jgi:hypothetical protein
MVDYVRLQGTALRLIAKNGTTYTYERLSAGPADAAKPWDGPATASLVAESVNLATVMVSPGAMLGMRLVSEDLLTRAEQVLLTCVPEGGSDLGDFHQAYRPNEAKYQFQWVERLRPAGPTLLYIIGVKQ